MRRTKTVIIGAGQAGLALSWALTRENHQHVLLERGRLGERWRSERWDSLALLTPNWANLLPGQDAGPDPDGFLSRDEFVASLEGYARSFGAPVREGTAVHAVRRYELGFAVTDSEGEWLADDVVVATGWCDVPALPAVARQVPAGVAHMHASRYRSPERLAPGGVMVVGAGASGQQIAYELAAAGRRVVLAAGRHARALRSYRGRDTWAWMRDIGMLDESRPSIAGGSGSLPLDGRDGGRTLDLGVLARAGVTLAGRLESFDGARAAFDGGLPERVADAEERFRALLGRIDRHIAEHALERQAPADGPIAPVDAGTPPAALDLEREGIRTIVWATGYRRHHPWLQVPVSAAGGDIVHRGGVTPVPGLYVLGRQWQSRRTSHQIGGVGADALAIAGHVLGGRGAHAARIAARAA